MTHIVLLGDSIFDNRAYTGGEPDVVTHLRRLIGDRARATLLAVDGATTRTMAPQVARVRGDATHLVVSIGGNDALGHSEILLPGRLGGDPLRELERRAAGFEADYRRALFAVFDRQRPVTVCTIYNGALPDAQEAARARAGLMVFNDAILRVAFERGASVIDLRLICNAPSDYANPIEPSGSGGLKIAQAIVRATGVADAGEGSRVIA